MTRGVCSVLQFADLVLLSISAPIVHLLIKLHFFHAL